MIISYYHKTCLLQHILNPIIKIFFMTLGPLILLIVIFGYISNWLNWRFLNYTLTRFLYYIGAVIHESSHAILCFLTGAKIYEFQVFSSQPHVTHGKPKLPLLGSVFISSAPIFGGLFFLFLINQYILKNQLILTPIISTSWMNSLIEPFRLLIQLNPLEWQSWVIILLLINAGAMIGPSIQDIKNIWLMVIVLFFFSSPILNNLCFVALSLIIVNILIQIILIVFLELFKPLVRSLYFHPSNR